MNSPQKYVSRLRRLYDEREIGVSKNSPPFSCCHLKSCRAAAKAHSRYLSLGGEAHVGEKYGAPIRLVVVALDTGGRGARTWRGEDLDGRRKVIQSVTWSEANPHMKGTLQILKQLYKVYEEERDDEVLRRFAMVNRVPSVRGETTMRVPSPTRYTTTAESMDSPSCPCWSPSSSLPRGQRRGTCWNFRTSMKRKLGCMFAAPT